MLASDTELNVVIFHEFMIVPPVMGRKAIDPSEFDWALTFQMCSFPPA
jgi:hypothetical protein